MLGAAVALMAALHKLLHAAVPVNDDFMHLTYSRQLLAGEWPVRDFFDHGMELMYALSALAQLAFGYRLLSEGLVIAVMTGVSTFLVYDIARRATGSITAALVAALLLVVATPRGYAYPKLIVYAVAAWLWWRYVWEPSPRRATVLGIWVAVAYYWRPDHGAYVAVGVTLAMVAAHGLSVATITRCLQSGTVAAALVMPWLVFGSVQVGGPARFVQSGLITASEEHFTTRQEAPRWPVRRVGDIIDIDPATLYAPTIGIRWTRDSSLESRRQVLQQYGLTIVSTRDEVSQSVRLSEPSIRDLRALLAQPILEDTDGVDRGASRVLSSTWPRLDRWRFHRWWLRLRVLPGLDEQGRAGEAAAILLVALPILALCAALPGRAKRAKIHWQPAKGFCLDTEGRALGWFRRYLPVRVAGGPLACFAVFTLVVVVGLVRTPFNVRVGEAVVLPGIVLGLLTAALLQMARAGLGWRRWPARASAAMLALLVMKSLFVAGQSGERVRWLAGDGSGERARIAWADASSRLWSTPPVERWRRQETGSTLRLAVYAHECLSPADRILVTWFAPEIYYYADRLMAGRHLFFLPALGTLTHERRMELEKLERSPAQIVFAKSMADNSAEETFPDLLEIFAREYRVGGSFVDDEERFQVLVRKDRAPVRLFGDSSWPCYR